MASGTWSPLALVAGWRSESNTMSDQTPPAPPDGGNGNGTPPPAAPPAPTASAPFIPTKEEWVESRKEMRQIRELLMKQTGAPAVTNNVTAAPAAPASTSPDLVAQVEDIKMDLAIERALRAAKVADNDPLAETLADLVKAKKPPDVAAFITQRAAALRPAGAAVPAPVVPPAAPSNTGAPASAPSAATTLPDDPRRWPPEVVEKLSPQEFRAALDKYTSAKSGINPLRHLRKR